MSYNGIGLSSVRGSATSGHVQANQGHVRASRRRRQIERNANAQGPKFNPVSATAREQGNKEIQEHERLRQIENQLLLLRDDLEENGSFTEEQMEERIQTERERQLQKLKQQQKEEEKQQQGNNNNNNKQRPPDYERGPPPGRGRGWNHDNNQQRGEYGRDQYQPQRPKNKQMEAAMKERENERVRNAFSIRKEAHVEGQAFDRELQERKKQERLAEKEKVQKQLEKSERKRARAAKRDTKKASRETKK